jgi:hypothetical protein
MSELIKFAGDAYVTDEKIAIAKKRGTTLQESSQNNFRSLAMSGLG